MEFTYLFEQYVVYSFLTACLEHHANDFIHIFNLVLRSFNSYCHGFHLVTGGCCEEGGVFPMLTEIIVTG